MSVIFDTFVVEFRPFPYTEDDWEDFFDTLESLVHDKDAPFGVLLSGVDTLTTISFSETPSEDEVDDAMKWAVFCIERAGGRGTITSKMETTIMEGHVGMVSDRKYLDTTAD